MNGFGGGFDKDGRMHAVTQSRPSTPSESASATRLLMVAAHQLANGLSPDLQRQIKQEARLVAQGQAGQQGAPWGMGPTPELQHAPGGELLEGVQHPAFTTVEHLFRVLPNDSWTSPDRTPQNPLTFELGSFTVPTQQIFLVTDYQFVALRQSGVDPFDFVQAEPYRFSGYLGFDIAVSGRRDGNLSYQLDPAPQQFENQSFDPGVPTTPTTRTPVSQFNRANANAFGSVAGIGKALLPVRPNVQGPRDQPFTRLAKAGDKVSLKCVIFRRIMAPLAGIQGTVSGYTIHTNTMSALLNRIRPR